ncbi:hypothetical protein GWI33_019069 [Rhynchophorus ferrugineus]|uniref:Uncharacterized protein n=1 Tax=Rhynchophorus ferrugineus TaxID=354439 RepID=A0A834M0U4_RHYFE|nr:hypothetical protein GWI33_019069 [Rhynchophorus ferrugineus]
MCTQTCICIVNISRLYKKRDIVTAVCLLNQAGTTLKANKDIKKKHFADMLGGKSLFDRKDIYWSTTTLEKVGYICRSGSSENGTLADFIDPIHQQQGSFQSRFSNRKD